MNPEDELELETLRRDVGALGGDPDAVLSRAAASAAPAGGSAPQFRDVGTYNYQYRDPEAPGAAPGPQQGPMADELAHLGVTKTGPDGFDRVDTGRLSLKNASATGELAREVEALRSEISALGGSPDAVLERVNRPAPRRARRGRTVAGDVELGDVTTDSDTSGYDLTTLEGAGQYSRDVMQSELRERRLAEKRREYIEAQQNGWVLPPLPPANAPETTRNYEGARQREEIDFDQRQIDELRAMGAYGTTDAERQAAIRAELEGAQMTGDTAGVARYRPSAAGFANEMNTGPRTGRTAGNISEEEVRRALQRREELFL